MHTGDTHCETDGDVSGNECLGPGIFARAVIKTAEGKVLTGDYRLPGTYFAILKPTTTGVSVGAMIKARNTTMVLDARAAASNALLRAGSFVFTHGDAGARADADGAGHMLVELQSNGAQTSGGQGVAFLVRPARLEDMFEYAVLGFTLSNALVPIGSEQRGNRSGGAHTVSNTSPGGTSSLAEGSPAPPPRSGNTGANASSTGGGGRTRTRRNFAAGFFFETNLGPIAIGGAVAGLKADFAAPQFKVYDVEMGLSNLKIARGAAVSASFSFKVRATGEFMPRTPFLAPSCSRSDRIGGHTTVAHAKLTSRHAGWRTPLSAHVLCALPRCVLKAPCPAPSPDRPT